MADNCQPWPVTDEKDNTVSWLQKLNDINARSTVYKNDVLYLHNKTQNNVHYTLEQQNIMYAKKSWYPGLLYKITKKTVKKLTNYTIIHN